MYPRLLRPGKNASFFLFGPRGTGKSSWVRSEFPNSHYFDLLDAELSLPLLANPSRLADLIPQGTKELVVLDEVQKIPALLDEVHRQIESHKRRFVLTGSSARKLRQKGTNLLAGRALTKFLYPLTARELGKDFNFRHSIRFGHLPMAYAHREPAKFLKSYVSTYLKEEVQQEGLTRNIEAFARFLEAASFSQGNVLNVARVAEDCHVERKVVEDYFEILRDLLLAVEIPVFSRRAKRKLIKHRKFYYFDVGVFRALRPKGPLDLVDEIDGAALETLVLQELLALNHYLDLGYDVFYWHTAQHEEVDFVLYGEKGLIAIEVKRSSRHLTSDIPGLLKFKMDYPMAKAICLYGGTKIHSEGELIWIPIELFLRDSAKWLGYSD